MQPQPDTYLFPDGGDTPNNPRLPLILLRVTAAERAEDPAEWLEQTFTGHGWGFTWRWGIYPFHHFHTTNHEVLGVSCGEADLLLGGKNGLPIQVTVGDVMIIPAGVGHKCVKASEDFEVVGAYPQGEQPDLIRSGEGNAESIRLRIAAVPLPEQDPIHGVEGPLFQYWK